jgi:ComF family protein
VEGIALCDCCIGSGEPIRFEMGALQCAAIGPYEGMLRSAILCMKKGRRDVGACLGQLLVERMRGIVCDTCLAPLPTTKRRRRERGFDQSELLARIVGSALDRPVLSVLTRMGQAQQGRSRNERLTERNRFALLPGAPVRALNLVLVDDVVTTGATLCDAALVLERAGARVQGAIFLAQA